ncbi:MAG: AraC family transcriptional regulator [Cyclobacteriaceae bacterium]
MFFVAGIAVAVFIEFLLISKKNKSDADKIMTAWMFLLAIHQFLFYLFYSEEIYNYPFLLGLEMPLPLLHGVLLYLYVGSMTNQLPKNRKLLWLHFLPTVCTFTYMSISFYGLPATEKIFVFQNEGLGYETFMFILNMAVNISGVSYVIWSSILLHKHKKNILDQFSDLEKVDLQWLQLLTWGLGVLWLVVIFFGGPYVFGTVVVFVFLIGFFGNKQGTIFTSDHSPAPKSEDKKEKYAKSGLKDDHSDELYKKLNLLMKEEEIYKSKEISIGDLAATLEVHPNYLSQVINEREGKNFYDYINSHRVEEFKKLISIPKNQNLTLLALAYDCGFNSKSSFNRFFKKATGQTPSQYFTSITHSEKEA